ncbi:MAG: hypothetical protein D6744_01390 [Planctomycetota bacterium]|nr:MAG: hypothetical protein D6744_01390 [Planctomycetota bacterium]
MIIGSAAVALVVVGWFVIRPMLSGEGEPAPSPSPPSPLVVDLIADSLTVSGRRATITYTVAGDEQAPPFDIVLFADRNENGRADADEALDRTPGEAAPGSHQAAFDLPGDFIGRIGVAFDTGDWSDDAAREATAANNMQFASVAEMGDTPTPPVKTPRMVDVAVRELSVADQEAAVVYSVAGDGEAPPYDIVLFRDDNGNRLPDPGEEIQRFPGEPQAGEHRIALQLPAGFEGTLVAQIDASQWPTDARDPAPDNNTRFASVAMTADERVARALADFPPQIEPTISLVELLSAHGGDANAVAAALAALGVPQTADVEWRDAWTPIAGDEPSARRSAVWTLPENDERVALQCAIRFDSVRQSWLADWSLSDDAFPAVSDWLRERTTRRIAQRNADGHWGAARRLYAATARLFAAWNAPLDEGMLAPAWSGLAGFAPPEDWNAEEDPVGYPPLLRSADGTRTFRRVSLTARSPVWELLGIAPQSRRAVLFYVDEREAPEAFDRLETADEAARRWGAQIPTREEWTLAALALGDAAWDLGFFDGRYEWCRDPSDPKNPTWVCGGCDLLDVLKPPPGKGPPTPALVQWLNHPLVSQPRVHGDGLATLRAVVHPFAPDAFARFAEQ